MGEIFVRPMPDQPMPFTGERLTSDLTGETLVEHWHRYLLAREIARGRDVLDIACGEGYGSALIAQVASSVVGVDVAEDAVAHATASYPAANLRFERGDARRIPLPDASIDLVVSFETLEHFVEHDEFLREVRRVLRPGGALLVSTPERDTYSPEVMPANPYHARELTESEFDTLLRSHFAHVASQGQRALLGSVLAGAERADGTLYCFERRGTGHFETSRGLARIRYIVALASDSPAWQLPNSVFIDTGRIGYTDGATLERLNTELPQLYAAKAEAERLQGEITELRAEHAGMLEARMLEVRMLEARMLEACNSSQQAKQAPGVTFDPSQLSSIQAEMKRLLTLFGTQTEAVSRMQSTHAERQAALAMQTRRADAMEAASLRAEAAARAAREQAMHMESQARGAEERAERAELEVRLLRSSTSWRLTAPLRALRMLVRRS